MMMLDRHLFTRSLSRQTIVCSFLRNEVSTTCVSGWAEQPTHFNERLIHALTQVVLTSCPDDIRQTEGCRTLPALPRVETRSLLQLFKQLSLVGADFLRHHDFQSHVFVAASALALIQTLPAQTKLLSALSAGRNGQLYLSLNRWRFDLCAQHRLPRRDG